MEVRDPIHGSISISEKEQKIISSPFFQRLRNIKQLGFSEYVFPGATHSRYLHSLGVMHLAGRIFSKVSPQWLDKKDFQKLHKCIRIAALLHDVGHAPLSHTTEFVMPSIDKLSLPSYFMNKSKPKARANHEDYTLKILLQSELTDLIDSAFEDEGFGSQEIAALISNEPLFSPDFFIIKGRNFFHLLQTIISSEMDADRMDYLLRDSYFSGVSYGQFDLDWIIDNLKALEADDKNLSLGISDRALATFDDFLLCRFHMFLMVYFHYRPVCLEQMLKRYFNSSNNEYEIPSQINEYLEHDDNFLYSILKKSKNFWAKKVVNNHVPEKVFESFHADNIENKDKDLIDFFMNEKIDYIKCSSLGRISKYYQKHPEQEQESSDYQLKVFSLSAFDKKIISIKNINQATDLYDKYKKTHSVLRYHCYLEHLNKNQKNKLIEICERLHRQL